ncbi:MAG: FHA domain-containing protein [Ardenticatenia bacterium]|nr:FHA domain-containing protein [Ardenticatenia bacterium]
MAESTLTLLIFVARMALLALLYAFLGLVAWLVWRDLTRGEGQREQVAPQASAHLVVVDGETSGLRAGHTFLLHTVTTIGRDLDNDIVVADTYTSSRHARIERRDGRWWLEDLGATNPTCLNGHPLSPMDPVPLDPGDVIHVGRTAFKFRA